MRGERAGAVRGYDRVGRAKGEEGGRSLELQRLPPEHRSPGASHTGAARRRPDRADARTAFREHPGAGRARPCRGGSLHLLRALSGQERPLRERQRGLLGRDGLDALAAPRSVGSRGAGARDVRAPRRDAPLLRRPRRFGQAPRHAGARAGAFREGDREAPRRVAARPLDTGRASARPRPGARRRVPLADDVVDRSGRAETPAEMDDLFHRLVWAGVAADERRPSGVRPDRTALVRS